MPPPIKVQLVDHNPEWQLLAESLRSSLMQTLGDNLLSVHHIGSTSIADICAKPIIDLMPEVRDLAELDRQRELVLSLGFEWWGEYGIAERRFCTLTDAASGVRVANVHCFQTGSPEIEKHLAFRDYLRTHAEIAQEYAAEKLRCRDLHANDSHQYTDAKAAWIAGIMPRALAFYRERRT